MKNFLCHDGDSLALFFRDCQVPSLKTRLFDEILSDAAVSEDYETIEKICTAQHDLTEENVNGTIVTLIPPGKAHRAIYDNTPRSTANFYWPCCYFNYRVKWDMDPVAAGLSPNWSYLPVECRARELTLVVFQGLVATFGILGNALVLVVMLGGGHRYEASNFMRTSLSLADFLTSVFVAAPAFSDSINIIYGGPDVKTVYIPSQFNLSSLIPRLPISTSDVHLITLFEENGRSFSCYFFNMKPTFKYDSLLGQYNAKYFLFNTFNYSNGPFQVFRAHFLCICSCVTMIIMFFLSIERVMICWRPSHYRKVFTLLRVKRGIVFAWSFGIISSIVISYGKSFTVYWHPLTKLTHGLRDTNEEFNIALIAASIMLGILGIFTILFSVAALIAFCLKRAEEEQERKEYNMRITDNFAKENLYITVSLIVITLLYILVYVPVDLDKRAKETGKPHCGLPEGSKLEALGLGFTLETNSGGYPQEPCKTSAM
ncbi:hypothetical protein SK128_023025 [Halocaridina rubra]|uniref:G-protein coupled receptors family 1 profile domain-containing protein n=1 Tax=Halocaridina rubra TaxID=373956 RepID=A0AAN8X744_HALRR